MGSKIQLGAQKGVAFGTGSMQFEWEAAMISTIRSQWKKRHEYGITLVKKPQAGAYDGIILAVAQREFREMGQQAIRALGKALHVLLELRYVLLSAHAASDLRL